MLNNFSQNNYKNMRINEKLDLIHKIEESDKFTKDALKKLDIRDKSIL